MRLMLLSVLLVSWINPLRATEHPNVILIMTDEQGQEICGACYVYVQRK